MAEGEDTNVPTPFFDTPTISSSNCAQEEPPPTDKAKAIPLTQTEQVTEAQSGLTKRQRKRKGRNKICRSKQDLSLYPVFNTNRRVAGTELNPAKGNGELNNQQEAPQSNQANDKNIKSGTVPPAIGKDAGGEDQDDPALRGPKATTSTIQMATFDPESLPVTADQGPTTHTAQGGSVHSAKPHLTGNHNQSQLAKPITWGKGLGGEESSACGTIYGGSRERNTLHHTFEDKVMNGQQLSSPKGLVAPNWDQRLELQPRVQTGPPSGDANLYDSLPRV